MVVMRVCSPMIENETKVEDTFCSSLNLCVAAFTVIVTATATVIVTEAGTNSTDLER